MIPYDPTIYQGSAAYYARGRPPYSSTLASTLATELGLDGTGRLLDVGCGPGLLTIELADCFSHVIGLDPDAEMLAEGARRAAEAGINQHPVGRRARRGHSCACAGQVQARDLRPVVSLDGPRAGG